MMFICGTGSTAAPRRRRRTCRAAGRPRCAAALAVASETPRMALAPSRLLLAVPSSSIMMPVEPALVLGLEARERVEDLAVHRVDRAAARPCRRSGPGRRRAARPPRGRRSRRRRARRRGRTTPSSSVTSTSTVGLPRLSRISRRDDVDDFGQEALSAGAVIRPRAAASVFLGREDLAALVHAGLQVDVVRPAQLAGFLVLDDSCWPSARGASGACRRARERLCVWERPWEALLRSC